MKGKEWDERKRENKKEERTGKKPCSVDPPARAKKCQWAAAAVHAGDFL